MPLATDGLWPESVRQKVPLAVGRYFQLVDTQTSTSRQADFRVKARSAPRGINAQAIHTKR